MMSTWLMRLLVVQYIIISIISLFEHNYIRALYWIGASIITVSVLLGTKI